MKGYATFGASSTQGEMHCRHFFLPKHDAIFPWPAFCGKCTGAIAAATWQPGRVRNCSIDWSAPSTPRHGSMPAIYGCAFSSSLDCYQKRRRCKPESSHAVSAICFELIVQGTCLLPIHVCRMIQHKCLAFSAPRCSYRPQRRCSSMSPCWHIIDVVDATPRRKPRKQKGPSRTHLESCPGATLCSCRNRYNGSNIVLAWRLGA